jgi:hypothetical protein
MEILKEIETKGLTPFLKEGIQLNEEVKLLTKTLGSFHLIKLISTLTDTDLYNPIRIKLLPFWTTSKEMFESYRRLSKDGNGKWGKVQLVYEGSVDFYIIICSTQERFVPSKTLLFQMEPFVRCNESQWGTWSQPEKLGLLKVFEHKDSMNNLEWHLSLSYSDLQSLSHAKSKNLSTVVSSKYSDEGHKKRIDFLTYCESKNLEIDIYGRENNFNYSNYKGSLVNKEDGLLPYKYTIACENNVIDNYVTEKLADSILSECLVFYYGCPNLESILDSRSFVRLSFNNFEEDYNLIRASIQNNEWEKRLPYIRASKHKILNELQFFPRIERELDQIINV